MLKSLKVANNKLLDSCAQSFHAINNIGLIPPKGSICIFIAEEVYACWNLFPFSDTGEIVCIQAIGGHVSLTLWPEPWAWRFLGITLAAASFSIYLWDSPHRMPIYGSLLNIEVKHRESRALWPPSIFTFWKKYFVDNPAMQIFPILWISITIKINWWIIALSKICKLRP